MATYRTDYAARLALRGAGMTLSKRDGEYRVAPCRVAFPTLDAADREAVASFHTDRDDAVGSGLATAASLRRNPLTDPDQPSPANPPAPVFPSLRAYLLANPDAVLDVWPVALGLWCASIRDAELHRVACAGPHATPDLCLAELDRAAGVDWF